MSEIIDFYSGEKNSEGYSLADLWAFDESRMEFIHDYIQYLFPLDEPSNYNPDAPVLTAEDVQVFLKSPELRGRLLQSAEKFLWFLGLRLEGGRVVTDTHFPRREYNLKHFNHNHLRITRMLRCFMLLGLSDLAREILRFLEEGGYGTDNSRAYWNGAVNGRN